MYIHGVCINRCWSTPSKTKSKVKQNQNGRSTRAAMPRRISAEAVGAHSTAYHCPNEGVQLSEKGKEGTTGHGEPSDVSGYHPQSLLREAEGKLFSQPPLRLSPVASIPIPASHHRPGASRRPPRAARRDRSTNRGLE